jgi:hypothetical protein
VGFEFGRLVGWVVDLLRKQLGFFDLHRIRRTMRRASSRRPPSLPHPAVGRPSCAATLHPAVGRRGPLGRRAAVHQKKSWYLGETLRGGGGAFSGRGGPCCVPSGGPVHTSPRPPTRPCNATAAPRPTKLRARATYRTEPASVALTAGCRVHGSPPSLAPPADRKQ